MIFFVSNLLAQVPTFQWAIAQGGLSNDDGRSSKIDAAGNIISTGYFQFNSDFDPSASTFSLNSNGMEDVFVSKLDATGNFMWAKQFGGLGSDWGNSLFIDGSNNIYITGYFSNTVDFDPGVGTFTLTALGNSDVFICKLDATGNFIWAKTFGGSGNDQANSIEGDGLGNVLVTGLFNGSLDFDPGIATYTMSSFGSSDVFVSKFDGLGNFVWAKQIGGSGDDEGYSLAIDASNNVHLTGYFNSSADFDPSASIISLTAIGQKDIFVSKLDASGNYVWAKSVGSTADDASYAIDIDGSGNVYTTGYFGGIADFDPSAGTYTLSYLGAWSDVFIYKLDINGNFVWAKAMNSWSTNEGHSLQLDGSGNVYTTGIFSNTMDFDPGPSTFYMTPSTIFFGMSDIYVSKLNSLGNFVWARSFGGNLSENSNSIALDALNNIYITGNFPTISDFDPGANIVNLTPVGGSDIFINKLGPCTSAPSAPINTTPISNQNICPNNSATLSVTNTGTSYWYATPSGTNIIGSGSVFVTPSLAIGNYTFYAVAATCTVSASRSPVTVTVSACAGIHEYENNTHLVSIYPNPTSGDFFIKVIGAKDHWENIKIEISNSLGQLISELYNQPVGHSEVEVRFDTKNLISGLYFIKTTYGGQSILKKLVVDH